MEKLNTMDTFKLCICGSRGFNDYETKSLNAYSVLDENVKKFVDQHASSSAIEVVSGTARGADTLGEVWALKNSHAVKRFPPNWAAYGKQAGLLRNKEMADYADGIIIFWDSKSPGAHHMISYASSLNKPFTVIEYNCPPLLQDCDPDLFPNCLRCQYK